MSKILVGITGGIAIYKVAQLVSNLSKLHEVKVIMSKSAQEFMSIEVFQALTKHKVYTDVFETYHEDGEELIAHVELAKWADIIVLAPATANIIGKFANGIADDMLSTTLMAARTPILIAPAMNTFMLNSPATRQNMETLTSRGVHIMSTDSGDLACGDFGNGKLAQPFIIQAEIDRILKETAEKSKKKQDLKGLSILVTAGPTREAIDPVRYITNHSTGKMGYAVAENALDRGASVTIISGLVNIEPPVGANIVYVESALDMYESVQANLKNADIFIMTAAVADYRAVATQDEKIKKSGEEVSLNLTKNPDIIAWASKNRNPGAVVTGFAMETENLVENARGKLERKELDLIAANSLRDEGAGFGTDTNVVTLITADTEEALPLLSKYKVAEKILDKNLEIHKEKN